MTLDQKKFEPMIGENLSNGDFEGKATIGPSEYSSEICPCSCRFEVISDTVCVAAKKENRREAMRITHSRPHIVIDAVLLFLTALAMMFLMNCQVIKVSGESMSPTLHDGEKHLMTSFGAPSVGDIVIFHAPDGGQLFIKRVAAGPGDEMKHYGEVHVLSGDEYFVLGDNCADSYDSRFFGPIKRQDIVGIFLF